jgi:hypothetical protein
MRAIMLTFVLLLASIPYSQANALIERYPWLVTKAWYQLCGNNPRLPFESQLGCCCFTPATGRHCVRPGRNGFLMNCIRICDAAPCR